MARVDLPSQNWAELREPQTIRQRDRKRILKATDAEEGPMSRMIAAEEMALALAVEKWSFDLPLPGDDLAVLEDLEIPDYDVLSAAAKPWADMLFPDFSLKMSDGRLEEGPT